MTKCVTNQLIFVIVPLLKAFCLWVITSLSMRDHLVTACEHIIRGAPIRHWPIIVLPIIGA